MPALTSLSLPSLKSAGMGFSITQMSGATEALFPALETVGGGRYAHGGMADGQFAIENMDSLTAISMPLLTTVKGNFGDFSVRTCVPPASARTQTHVARC